MFQCTEHDQKLTQCSREYYKSIDIQKNMGHHALFQDMLFQSSWNAQNLVKMVWRRRM